uniref:DUF4283 domain-containing protein n=1 Tax=Quercus lobata TaxID=97700 RepID=A0A7N2M1C5_QUELO
MVNIEAVARTFRPIWRTKRNFEFSMAGDNILLIAFELEVDVEKVLQDEPWVFDRHLVVLIRYDGSVPVQELSFDRTSFWVQIHNLPFALMTVEAAISLGETLGVVSKPRDTSEMIGGNFMRVQVAVDVTKPLCRGKVITWDGREGWASFIKGDLSGVEQQFGPWLRTAQFNPSRKTRVEVQGYDGLGTHQTTPSTAADSQLCQGIISTVAALARMVDTRASATDTGDSITTAPMVGGSNDGTKKRDKHVLGRNTTSPQEQIPDFEAMIKDIDDTINTEFVTLILNTHSPDSLQLLAGNDQYVEINGGTTEVLGNQEGNLEKMEAKLTSQLTRLSPTKVKFEMGWAEKQIEGKGSKSRPKFVVEKVKEN